MSNLMTERGGTPLWLPGDELPIPDYTLDPAMLREAFTEYVAGPNAKITSLDEASLSALTFPTETPRGFLFVDIDDLVGDLSGSLQGLQYAEPLPAHARANNHDYGEGMFFNDDQTFLKHALIAYIKQSEVGMRPAEDIDDIRRNLQVAQAHGVYVTFLTASTPASELPTVTNFIGKHFRGACDGIVITSGDYRVADKGAAARGVIEFVDKHTDDPLPVNTPVVAIDDWPRHTVKIRDAVQDMPHGFDVTTIQYTFPSSQTPDAGSEQFASVLACFERATDLLTEEIAQPLSR